MKILFDLFPVILFFIAFKVKGIYVATAVAIAAAVLQVVYSWVRYKKVDTMAWVGMGGIGSFWRFDITVAQRDVHQMEADDSLLDIFVNYFNWLRGDEEEYNPDTHAQTNCAS